MRVDMSRVQVNGMSLWCETHGASGSPVVMVHGSWVDHHHWDLVVPRLAESHIVLTYDRRGHSQSERPTSQGGVHDDVADLAALIEHDHLAPAHLVGNSFGGSICLRLATERPELIRSLAVHEPPLWRVVEDDPATAWVAEAFGDLERDVAQYLAAGDMAGGARRFVESVASGTWDAESPEVRERFIANAPSFLDETGDPEARTLDLEKLKKVDRPTLITLGETTAPIFGPIAQRIADVIPAVTRHTFLGAGHVPDNTHPDEFSGVVSSFIASC
jgi:pimeloyl-ACP methyl ester carboxylesterase